MATLPAATVPRRPQTWNPAYDPHSWAWDDVPPLPPFILADGSGLAVYQTAVHAAYDDAALYIRYICDDPDIWGESTARDSHIYDEEVVELFIAPGFATPVRYYEFEVSPLGALLDLSVHNPDLDRRTLVGDFSWDCPGLRWAAVRDDANDRWYAYLIVPWTSLGASATLPRVWRANFYRIERPRNRSPEFSCWSPTMSDPADYHRPAFFGFLTLA